MAKGYVPIFFDWLETTQDLTAEEKGNLIDAVVLYACGKEYEHLLCGACRIAFRFMQGQVDRNAKISKLRQEARLGKKQDGNQEQNTTNENKPEQNASSLPNKNNNKNDNKNKNNNNAGDPPRRFTPPTVAEVAAYCKERNNGINPDYFVDYYAARGWVLSNGKQVRDWRACVRTWENRAKERGDGVITIKKQVSAQQFTQRDYSGEDEAAMQRMLAMFAEEE